MRADFEEYASEIEDGLNDDSNSSAVSLFKTLDDFEEEDARWVIDGWMPEGQITVLASDGGVGKTTLWCDIAAAVSNGSSCILDPVGTIRKPSRVLFMSAEDSIKTVLKKKLRAAGANMANIVAPDFSANGGELLHTLKFGTEAMTNAIRLVKPALCIFDPIQGFVPPEINMGNRNSMRDCLAPLVTLGEETGTTFLIIVHSNKRKAASGRDRIADSADLWDIARSVWMAGYSDDEGVRYLSNEKNSYAEKQKTLLFSIDENGRAVYEGTTWKRDREFQDDKAISTSAPKREDCRRWMLMRLNSAGGSMLTRQLEDDAKAEGYANATIRRAKDSLKAQGDVFYQQRRHEWHVCIAPVPSDI